MKGVKMKLLDKLKEEFPMLNEDLLLRFIDEAREEVKREDEQSLPNAVER